MEMKRKRKVVLKDDALEYLKRNNPEAFEVREYTVKVKLESDFIKHMQHNQQYRKYIVENLWVTYLWYLYILYDSLTYENIVNFNVMKEVWVKEWMIKISKRIFKEHNIIKKHNWYYYLNPNVAMKWEAVNPNIIELFK